MRFHLVAGLAVLAVACAPPSPQPQPNEMEQVVNATRTDTAAPPGALGNESVNYPEGNITPAERESASQMQIAGELPAGAAAEYVRLIQQGDFDRAYAMWHPAAADFTAEQLEQVFAPFETMDAAIGDLTPKGDSDVYEVQLTLTGRTEAGSNYSLTGPMTLSRSGSAQGRWRIAKMVLTGNPRAAEAIVDQ